MGEDVQSVSNEVGYRTASIYSLWRNISGKVLQRLRYFHYRRPSRNERVDVEPDNFIRQTESYKVWYQDIRIKLFLGWLSLAEFRTKMGITV